MAELRPLQNFGRVFEQEVIRDENSGVGRMVCPMIEKVCHIGPARNVQGGIGSVLCCYRDEFHLPNGNFIASYNGSFVRSLPLLFFICFKLLLFPSKKFELYQMHMSSYGSFFRKYLISLCLRIRRKKYIVHIHGSEFKKFCNNSGKFCKLLLRNYFAKACCTICITPDMKDFLECFLGDRYCLKMKIVPNPCRSISAEPENLLEHKLPVKVVFSGRYGHRKGVYDLIRAFDKACFTVSAELYLFGDGEVEKVRSAVEKLSRQKQIHVNPWLENGEYLQRLKKYDLLVLPSYSETFGMSIVEAMGVGLPIISSFSGGIPFVVEQNETGILCEAGDISALTEALEKLVNDRNLRIRMGEKGWVRAKKNFSLRVVFDELESIYGELCG